LLLLLLLLLLLDLLDLDMVILPLLTMQQEATKTVTPHVAFPRSRRRDHRSRRRRHLSFPL